MRIFQMQVGTFNINISKDLLCNTNGNKNLHKKGPLTLSLNNDTKINNYSRTKNKIIKNLANLPNNFCQTALRQLVKLLENILYLLQKEEKYGKIQL